MLRTGYKRTNLLEYLDRQRPVLIWCALVLVQNWIAHGRPPGSARMASFDSWAQVTGGILETAGIPGFLENQEWLREKADPLSEEWRGFVGKWWTEQARDLGKWFSGQDLFQIAADGNFLLSIWGEKSVGRGQLVAFIKALRSKEDAIFIGFRIERGKDTRSGGGLYRLRTIDGA